MDQEAGAFIVVGLSLHSHSTRFPNQRLTREEALRGTSLDFRETDFFL
jgi:hypothetical protein